MAGVLIIVENLTVPLDRRVWQEAKALTQEGYTVSVVCPKGGQYQQSYELREGIHIFRHPLPIEADGIAGYIIEYVWSWLAEIYLAIKAYRKVGFEVIQACNPPDTIFAIGIIFKLLTGTKFVFDHHDPFAALFEVKFPGKKFLNWLPSLAEKWSLKAADEVITTSEELRKLAVHKHGIDAGKINLVRSGIDLKRMGEAVRNEELKKGRQHLALYVGVMGVQDGLDLLLQSVKVIVHDFKRNDITFALAGSGTELQALKKMAIDLGVADYVDFTGHLEGHVFLSYFATADVGVCPDPKNVFNDKLSMNKVLEYMAFGIPVVQYDLTEGTFIAADSSLYAQNNDPHQFAQKIIEIIDNQELAQKMGEIGKQRIESHFAWEKQEQLYISIYNRLLGRDKNIVQPQKKAS